MRGSPLLRLILMAAALVIAGVPVWLLTRRSDSPLAVPAAETTATVNCRITLTASAPAVLTVSKLGELVLSTAPGTLTANVTIPVDPSQPDDVVIRGEWSNDASEQALRVEVETEGKDTAVRTFWGRGNVEDVVTP